MLAEFAKTLKSPREWVKAIFLLFCVVVTLTLALLTPLALLALLMEMLK